MFIVLHQLLKLRKYIFANIYLHNNYRCLNAALCKCVSVNNVYVVQIKLSFIVIIEITFSYKYHTESLVLL